MTVPFTTPDTLLSASNTATSCQSVALTSTKVLTVFYRDVLDATYGIVSDITGGNLVPGSATSLHADGKNTNGCAVAVLSSTLALVAVEGLAFTVTISGTTLTPNASATFDGAATGAIWLSLCALSATKGLVTYRTTGAQIYGCVLDISGTTVTPGTPVQIKNADVIGTSVDTLSSAVAIVGYIDVGNSNRPTANILSVSGSTFSVSSAVVVEAIQSWTGAHNEPGHKFITALSATSAVMVYGINSTKRIKAVALSISGTVITAGTSVEVSVADDAYDEYPTVCPYGSGVLVGWDSTVTVQAATLSVSGTVITHNSDTTNIVPSITPASESLASLGASYTALSYVDFSGTDSVNGTLLGGTGFTHSAGGIPGLILVA